MQNQMIPTISEATIIYCAITILNFSSISPVFDSQGVMQSQLNLITRYSLFLVITGLSYPSGCGAVCPMGEGHIN